MAAAAVVQASHTPPPLQPPPPTHIEPKSSVTLHTQNHPLPALSFSLPHFTPCAAAAAHSCVVCAALE